MQDEWLHRLSEYADGDLPEELRVELEAQLATDDELRAVLDQIRAVKERAAGLPDLPPETDLWPGIETRIRALTDARASTVKARRPPQAPRRRVVLNLPQLAAAAVLLLLLGAGTAWLSRGFSRAGGPVATGVSGSSPPTRLTSGEQGGRGAYEASIRDLETMLEVGEGSLDTATVRVLENSLATIDRAIAQARQALKADPANAYLSRHLADAMTRKLRLLERARVLAGT